MLGPAAGLTSDPDRRRWLGRRRDRATSAGGGVERDPTEPREVHLHPRVRTARPNRFDAGALVEVTGQEALHQPRRDPAVPEDRGHRGGEVFAITPPVRSE